MFPILYIFGTPVQTYFFVMSLVYTLSIIWIFKRSRILNLKAGTAMDLSLAIMIGGLLGARIVHVLFEYPEIYETEPARAFFVWQGGFVFYGGLIGAVLAGCILAKYKNENIPQWLDAFTPLIPVGYALGRIGCFLTGCCYGKFCDLPWSVHFPDIVGNPPAGLPRHPVQIYDALISLGIYAAIRSAEKHKSKLFGDQSGFLFLTWVFLYSLSRMVTEVFRDDFRGPTFGILSISMAVSLLLALISGFFIFKRSIRKSN